MRPSDTLVFILASIPSVIADVKFSVPAAGAPVPGGTSFAVTWTDSGVAPSISDLTAYQLFLFTGSNAQPQQLSLLANAAFSAGNTITVTVPVGIGASTPKNAYFLGMISTAAAGGTVTNYSDRFTMTGMTGVFSPAVVTALASISGTSGPPTVNAVAAAVPNAGATAAAGGADVPYNLQSGTIRYAPMQPVPPTKITATNTSPLYPTSAVTLASTILPIPSIVTTITQAQTFSVASHANTAAPASQPVDDMQKYLNRWKD